MSRRLLALAVLAAALAPLAGGASADSAPTARVEVIASTENAGPLDWKLWRVYVRGGGAITDANISLPPGDLDVDTLQSLPDGTVVGSGTITQQLSSDAEAVRTAPLLKGSCAPSTGRNELHLAAGDTCVSILLEGGGGLGFTSLQIFAPPFTHGTTEVGLRFNARTWSGETVVPPNPADPVTKTVSADVHSPELRAAVREISGGRTHVSLSATPTSVLYGHPVVLSGRVIRGNQPSGGEHILVRPVYFDTTGMDVGPAGAAITAGDGTFTTVIHPHGSYVWGAWAYKPPAGGVPRTNLLPGTLSHVLAVRAPKPQIRKRILEALPGERVRAEISVRNPIWRQEGLRCRLYVNGKQVLFRHFPFDSATLVERIRAKRGARVQAAMAWWTRKGDLVPGWSRVIRL